MVAKVEFSIPLPEMVVVTGAASGLGEQLCLLLVECGVKTFGIDVAAASSELSGRAGYVHIVGDVSDEPFWDKTAAQIRATSPVSLGLVTSAAILDVGAILETTKAGMMRALNVNVIGTALAIKAMLPLMIGLGGGSIVAVASVDGTFAEQQLSVYAATKGAVRQLARTIAMDHARQGVRVNVLSPGPMMAGLFKRHLESAADPARFHATRANRQPSGEILDPRDVARAALFLLSSASAAFIGADLMADGGLSTSFDFRTGSEGASV
jgi:NAD(P)-dependent dehydrogenase (short-subunit alcohol dehydrogenase family)